MSEALASPEEPDPRNYPESLRWTLAREAVCNLGLSQREASERYGLSYDALRQRCVREEWPTIEKVSKLVTQRSLNREIAEQKAVNWSEKGELAKVLAFDIAHTALTKAKEAPPEVKDWADVERIDKMARRAAGLDNGDATNVSQTFNFALLGDRLDGEIEAEVREIPSSGDTLAE